MKLNFKTLYADTNIEEEEMVVLAAADHFSTISELAG